MTNVHNHRRRVRLLLAAVTLSVLAACGSDGPETGSANPTSDTATAPPTAFDATDVKLTLLAYDSFVAPEALATFTAETGITVTVAAAGDTGTMVNKALLTAGNPEGDVLWGLDSTLLSRALATDVFTPYLSTAGPIAPEALALVPGGEVTPVNTSDVCLNVDIAWFDTKGLVAPTSLEELTDPAYKDLLVVQNPATSSPGLAFMLATIANFEPSGFIDYWSKLRENGVLVVDSWDAAYYTEFTAGGGDGSRPIAVSYASSPPFSVVDGVASTATVDAACYRIVEFAGVLRGSEHEAEARQLIDFMVSEAFQAQLPDSNYVYPVRVGTPLPELFATFGKPSTAPLMVPPGDIDANREQWIDEWTSAVVG
jgi:thiamine transport system substrate-binding protein